MLSQMIEMKINVRTKKDRMYPNMIRLFKEKVKMMTLLRRTAMRDVRMYMRLMSKTMVVPGNMV